MDINEAFPSKYLKASDLQGRQPTVTISHVVMEEVGKDKDRRPCLYFVGKEKGIVLNKTNAANITNAYTSNTDAWVNRSVTLFTVWTDFQGQSVEAIRVRPITQQQPAQQAPAPQPQFAPPPQQQAPVPPQFREVQADDIPF